MKKSIVLILVVFLFAFSVVSTSADPTGAEVYTTALDDQPWGGEAPEKYTAVPPSLQWSLLGMQLSLMI